MATVSGFVYSVPWWLKPLLYFVPRRMHSFENMQTLRYKKLCGVTIVLSIESITKVHGK